MIKNVGTIDRIIRVVIALAILGFYLLHVISGTTAIILGALAIILLLTSLVSFCPIYFPFKISTRKAK
jgi:hypothetical protein